MYELTYQIRELGGRISVLTAEIGQIDASSEYIHDVFHGAEEGSPAHLLFQEVKSDLQTTTRDLRKASARHEYVPERLPSGCY